MSIAARGHVGTIDSAITRKIKVTLPAKFCAGREERVRVRVEGEEVGHRLRAVLTKKGQAKSEAVAITRNEKDGSYLLFVKPQELGGHTFLSLSVANMLQIVHSCCLLTIVTTTAPPSNNQCRL